MSPDGAVPVDLLSNRLLAPALEDARLWSSQSGDGYQDVTAQMDWSQDSLYHLEVASNKVHVIAPDLRRSSGATSPLCVAWHP